MSQPCLPYDSRFQAATLEEAMISFPDLSIDQEEPGQIVTLQEQESCQTKECLDCQNEMKKKLKKVGLMPRTADEILDVQNTTTCKKYRFSRNDEGVYEKHHGRDSDSSSEEDDRKHKWKRKGRKHHGGGWRHFDRRKRQVQPANTSGQAIIAAPSRCALLVGCGDVYRTTMRLNTSTNSSATPPTAAASAVREMSTQVYH
ncbi:hypothetical protein TELCIR_11015 [Teladorsagia circumcincta]|uniref:Uncharacterized protein n=1 Tax=Teladorsagia circumcincta TaxID=45464 RepID=A0A2G9UBW9_TELCI|nr:hypothetical protein TELCIR_11015 [Teladorsagia circumcincta]